MISIISKFPIILQVCLINSAFLILIISVYLFSKYGLKLYGNKKGFFLSIGDKNNKNKKTDNGISIIDAMKNIREIEKKIFDLKYIDSIRLQMDIVENSTKMIMNQLLKTYTSLLKKKRYPDPIKTTSCQSYMLLLKIIENRIIDHIRCFIRKNHFANKNEFEFNLYIESKIDMLTFLVNETLNDLYHYDIDINRAELSDSNTDEMREFEKNIRDCFQRCKAISLNANQKITQFENKSNSIFVKFSNSTNCNQ